MTGYQESNKNQPDFVEAGETLNPKNYTKELGSLLFHSLGSIHYTPI